MFSRQDLVKLLVPIIIEQILAVLVGMADVVMVAAVGETAVSGVSLVDSISILIIQMMAALATGGTVVAAQYIGRKRIDKARETAGQLLLVALIFSVTVMVIALVGNRHILTLIFGRGVEQAVMDNAATYFWICALSYPFLAVYNSCAALFRSMGNSKVSMQISLVMNIINVGGNALCIYGLKMGVEGVAIPTLIARAFAALMILKLIQNPQNEIRITGVRELKPNGELIRSILRIGVPNSLENGMFQFGKIALQSLIATLGTVAIASYAVAFNLVTLLYLPGNSIGLGLVTIVGQCVGAKEYGQVKSYTKMMVALNYCILAVTCTILILWNKQFVGLYNLSPEASAIACSMVVAHSVAMIIWPPGFTLPHMLRATGDVRFTMVVSISCMWIFRIGFAYLFVKVFEFGVLGVWYGMFVDWIVRGCIYLWRFHRYGRNVKE